VVLIGDMTTRTFDTLLASYSPGVQQVARTARKLLLDMLPGGRESVDPSAPVVGYGYGAGYKGLICTLILSKSGVKLGVIRGAELPDPTACSREAAKNIATWRSRRHRIYARRASSRS
jgi:hypothetical protein